MKPDHICRHVRTKKMYIPALAHEAFPKDKSDVEHAPHCWCNCTLTETGPDDRPVGMQTCTTGRSCFEE